MSLSGAVIRSVPLLISFIFFFFNDTATTEIYTLSLHDALPISNKAPDPRTPSLRSRRVPTRRLRNDGVRSEEHTSELQSRQYLVCRLLLEKKKKCRMKAFAHSRWARGSGRRP